MESIRFLRRTYWKLPKSHFGSGEEMEFSGVDEATTDDGGGADLGGDGGGDGGVVVVRKIWHEGGGNNVCSCV